MKLRGNCVTHRTRLISQGGENDQDEDDSSEEDEDDDGVIDGNSGVFSWLQNFFSNVE